MLESMDPNRSVIPTADPESVLPAGAVEFAGCTSAVRHVAAGRETTGRPIRIEGDGGMRIPRRGGQPFASDA